MCYWNIGLLAITSFAGMRRMMLSAPQTMTSSLHNAFSCSILFSANSKPYFSFSENSLTDITLNFSKCNAVSFGAKLQIKNHYSIKFGENLFSWLFTCG